MKFFLLINVEIPTIVGISTFVSRKNSNQDSSEPEKYLISWYFYTYKHLKFVSQLSWAWKSFIILGPGVVFGVLGMYLDSLVSIDL